MTHRGRYIWFCHLFQLFVIPFQPLPSLQNAARPYYCLSTGEHQNKTLTKVHTTLLCDCRSSLYNQEVSAKQITHMTKEEIMCHKHI